MSEIETSQVDSVIEQAPGESAVSFDDLEHIDEIQSAQKKSEKKAEPKKTSEALDKKLGAKDQKPKKKSAEPDDEGTKEVEVEDSLEDVASDKENVKPKKLVKLKSGNETSEIDAEAKIPHKIDGVETEVSVQELLNNYSGKVAWDKRFTELEGQRRTFKTEQAKLQNNIDSVMKTWTEGNDPEGAFYVMAEKFGYDPIKLRKDLYDSMIPGLEKYYGMSEAERKQADLEFENKLLKKQTESEATRRANEEASRALDSKVKTLQEAHQISQTDFVSRYDELETLVKEGKLTQEITPDFVAETIVKDKLWTAMDEVLGQSAPELQGEAKATLLMDLCNEGFQKGLSAKDMKDIVQELYPSNKKAKTLSEKVREAERERGEKPASRSQGTKNPATDPLFFDDL